MSVMPWEDPRPIVEAAEGERILAWIPDLGTRLICKRVFADGDEFRTDDGDAVEPICFYELPEKR